MTPFNKDNSKVRQIITPDGTGELESQISNKPGMYLVKVKMPGKKLSDHRTYSEEQLQEVEK